MAQSAEWTLKEARDRCVDPELLRRQQAAFADWRAAGSPQRWTPLRGRRRRATSAEDRRLMSAVAETEAAARRFFFGLFLEERLLAWSRRGSPTAEPQPIPASAWQHLSIINAETSVLVERAEAKTRHYDVRVFPPLHSPQCVELLAGLSLVEAARRYVLDDAEVRARAPRAMELVPRLDWMFERFSWSEYLQVPWPLWITGDALDEDDVIGMLADPLPEEVVEAKRVLGDRVLALLAPLRDGRLEAQGVPARPRDERRVPSSIWSHRLFHADLASGDILQENARATSKWDSATPRWLGIMLEKSVDRTVGVETPATSSWSQRRRPRREAVQAALATLGIDPATDARSYKSMAAEIASRLEPPVRSEGETAALAKMIERIAKKAKAADVRSGD